MLFAAHKQRTVVIESLDMDGCLFHPRYCEFLAEQLPDVEEPNENLTPEENPVIAKNLLLLADISKCLAPNDSLVLMLGSNRQSLKFDKRNRYRNINRKSFNTGSAFQALLKIESYLKSKHPNTTLERFLLADLYSTKEHGTAYEMAINPPASVTLNQHPDWKFDDSKFTLIYAQIHQIAAKIADDTRPIVYNFTDDRTDILEGLSQLFNKHPSLIPNNVTVNFYHYEPQSEKQGRKPYGTVKGIGHRDAAYQEHLQYIMKKLLLPHDEDEAYYTVQHLTEATLNAFEQCYTQPQPKELDLGVIESQQKFSRNYHLLFKLKNKLEEWLKDKTNIVLGAAGSLAKIYIGNATSPTAVPRGVAKIHRLLNQNYSNNPTALTQALDEIAKIAQSRANSNYFQFCGLRTRSLETIQFYQDINKIIADVNNSNPFEKQTHSNGNSSTHQRP